MDVRGHYFYYLKLYNSFLFHLETLMFRDIAFIKKKLADLEKKVLNG